MPGIDVRKIWTDEAESRHGFREKPLPNDQRRRSTKAKSLSKALAATGDYFPLLFRELTAVGEETGKLEAVYKQLADHYRATPANAADVSWPRSPGR